MKTNATEQTSEDRVDEVVDAVLERADKIIQTDRETTDALLELVETELASLADELNAMASFARMAHLHGANPGQLAETLIAVVQAASYRARMHHVFQVGIERARVVAIREAASLGRLAIEGQLEQLAKEDRRVA